MFVLRLVGVFCAVALLSTLLLFFIRRDRRYLRWAWRILQFAFATVILVLVLYVLERLIVIV